MSKKSKKKDKLSRKEQKEEAKLSAKSGLAQETKNGIWGVVAFGFAIITTLAFFGTAGVAGDMFADLSKSLFGWGIFLIPVSLLIVGIAFFKSVERNIKTSLSIGITIF